jgi:hypothetical protein
MSLELTFLKPDFVIDSKGTVLETTTINTPMPSYDYIPETTKTSTMSISNFSGIMSYVALVVLIVLLFKGSYALLFVS